MTGPCRVALFQVLQGHRPADLHILLDDIDKQIVCHFNCTRRVFLQDSNHGTLPFARPRYQSHVQTPQRYSVDCTLQHMPSRNIGRDARQEYRLFSVSGGELEVVEPGVLRILRDTCERIAVCICARSRLQVRYAN